MMIAASTACGRWWRNGVNSSRVDENEGAGTTEDMPVTAPAARFTAERENEPLTGNDWVMLPSDVGEALPDQFLVGVDALPGADRHGLGDRDRFHEPNQGDDQRARDEGGQRVPGEPGQGNRRQPLGNRADNLASSGELDRRAVHPRDAPPATVVGRPVLVPSRWKRMPPAGSSTRVSAKWRSSRMRRRCSRSSVLMSRRSISRSAFSTSMRGGDLARFLSQPVQLFRFHAQFPG